MTPILRYGESSSLVFEPDACQLVGCFGLPEVEPVEDVAAEVRRALSEPLDYPPFSAVVAPNDRVALALADDVPCRSQIVAAVVECLLEHQVAPEAITVLRSGRLPDDDPGERLPADVRRKIALVEHEPDRREALAYLGATERGEAILLHRALFDADLVLPIGRFQGRSAAGYFGLQTPIHPTYSSSETLRRFRSAATLDARGRRRKKLTAEADEVGWLLGAVFTIQAAPVSGDRLRAVLAGQVDAVRRRGMELLGEYGKQHLGRRASLVVAGVEGGRACQTWENLGRALENARPLVEEGGSLIVCTALDARPGEAVCRLAAEKNESDVLKHLRRADSDDAVAALELLRAREYGHVYLLSRLDDALVEDLGLAPLGSPADALRMVQKASSTILLGDAPYTQVTMDNDQDEGFSK